ncbi:MAG: hypothetical protein ACFB2W_09200 [Leptolyngbyaceae cyanobacterium]
MTQHSKPSPNIETIVHFDTAVREEFLQVLNALVRTELLESKRGVADPRSDLIYQMLVCGNSDYPEVTSEIFSKAVVRHSPRQQIAQTSTVTLTIDSDVLA